MIDNPIRRLLGLDFDIPAFHRKDKKLLAAEPIEEPEELEDSEQYSDSDDDVRLKLRVSPKSKAKQPAQPAAGSHLLPSHRTSPQRTENASSLRPLANSSTRKRPSDDAPTETGQFLHHIYLLGI